MCGPPDVRNGQPHDGPFYKSHANGLSPIGAMSIARVSRSGGPRTMLNRINNVSDSRNTASIFGAGPYCDLHYLVALAAASSVVSIHAGPLAMHRSVIANS
jgi:hypothetical protein